MIIMEIKGIIVKQDNDLLPCPFCGSDVLVALYQGGYFAKCPVCDAMMARQISVVTEQILPFDSEEDMIKAWNKRRIPMNPMSRHKTGKSRSEEAEGFRAKVVEYIKDHAGQKVQARDIAFALHEDGRRVSSNMPIIKREHPEIKTEAGRSGYMWKE